MAFSLENLRAKIATSIHGRRLGIDNDGFLVGAKPVRNIVTNATTSTTATDIPNSGYHTVNSTTDGGWDVADPVPGCEVTITAISASTNTLTFNSATVYSTNGIASSQAVMNALGESITLQGVSTSQWVCTSNNSAVVFSS